MDRRKFAEFEKRVLEQIPPAGTTVGDVVQAFSSAAGGYGRTDAKAALLALKEDGKVKLDDRGNLTRTAP